MSIGDVIGRLARRVAGTFPARVVNRYLKANGPVWATVVAWNLLFALFPILLLASAGAGLVLNAHGGAQIGSGISSVIPGRDGALLAQALQSFRHSAGILAIVGIVGLLWSGSALFGSIDQALDVLYPCATRGFVSQKLMSFAMVIIFAILIVVVIATSSSLSLLQHISAIPLWIRSGAGGIALQACLGAIVGIALMVCTFRIVPRRRPSWTAILPAAAVSGIAFEAINLLFPVYFRLQHGFTTYGATLGLFFVVLTYAFFVSQVVVIGGAIMVEADPPHGEAGHVDEAHMLQGRSTAPAAHQPG